MITESIVAVMNAVSWQLAAVFIAVAVVAAVIRTHRASNRATMRRLDMDERVGLAKVANEKDKLQIEARVIGDARVPAVHSASYSGGDEG